MTGTVKRVIGTTYCFILGQDKIEYFAHLRDHVEPKKTMLEGVPVSFRLKLAKMPGKNPPVTDVELLAA